MESLESLMSVARGVLKEENQGHVDESDANENINGTPKQVYLNISYSKKSVSTSKSKIFSSKRRGVVSTVAPWCSGYHYWTTSFNKV